MAEYQVLYWKQIPSMVKAREGGREGSERLSMRFQEYIDEVAMADGLAGTDAYLDMWEWGPTQVREGSPEAVAKAVAAELEAAHPAVGRAKLGFSSS